MCFKVEDVVVADGVETLHMEIIYRMFFFGISLYVLSVCVCVGPIALIILIRR